MSTLPLALVLALVTFGLTGWRAAAGVERARMAKQLFAGMLT